ncbi:MAG: hypothetical protein J6Q89_05075 [Clostridia bacterium]|nr:hypothetical protein [Clostridia bacterium]
MTNLGAFSGFKEKSSKKNKQETPTVASHYTKLARRASFIRYAVLVFVLLFAVYSFSFHGSEITVDNFEYMMKFLNVGEEAEMVKGSVLAFDGSKGNRGLTYKGDLALLNENGLTITGWDGEVMLRETFTFDHPKMVENGINIFCYDLGGKEVRIFNSYSQLAKLSFDYPVYCVSASKSGEFAVVSSKKGYRSAVYVYDKDFRIRYTRLFGSEYADFASLSPDGQEFVTASHFSQKGNLVTKISKFNINDDSDTPLFSQEYVGEVPLGIYYTDEGYRLLTTDALRTFDNDNNCVAEVSFAERELLSGRVFGERTLVNYGLDGLSGGTEAVIYRTDGSIEVSRRFDSALTDAIICGNKLYTLSPGVLTESDITTGNQNIYNIPTSYSALVSDGEELILFSENQAEYFDSSSFDRKENN